MSSEKHAAAHNALAKMWNAGSFEPVIRYIRFPYFRNLEAGLRIDFNHPITALVGPNGTNKSSILRAIQGCPEGQNIGKYWFGTPLDVIPDSDRHRFIYGRWSDSASKVVEIIQLRRARRRGPGNDPSADYFETDGPVLSDGMEPMPPHSKPLPPDRKVTRWKAIQKEVSYFDFRAEVSAFDKYFYHNDSQARGRGIQKVGQQLRERKSFLAAKSRNVKMLLDERRASYKPGGKQMVIERARALNTEEVSAVSTILGRPYELIETINHRLFKTTGVTARIKTSHLSYSEAWAGSGEFAIIRLVALVIGCAPKSLLLLDEPEVSLHPGAQVRLIEFLTEQAKLNKLQIVIATHSPTIVNTLPAGAIKVLDRRASDGKIFLRGQSSFASDAFVVLEHATHRKTVFVEDELAKAIVKRALRRGVKPALNRSK